MRVSSVFSQGARQALRGMICPTYFERQESALMNAMKSWYVPPLNASSSADAGM